MDLAYFDSDNYFTPLSIGLIASYFIITVPLLVIYFQKRRMHSIKVRSPYWAMMCVVTSSLVLIRLGWHHWRSYPYTDSDGHIATCFVMDILMSAASPGFWFSLLARTATLYTKFAYQKKIDNINIAQIYSPGKEESDEAQLLEAQTKKKSKNQQVEFIMMVMYVVYVLIYMIAHLSLNKPFKGSLDSSLGQPVACIQTEEFGILVVALQVAMVVLVIFFWFKLRNMRENFFIRIEILSLALVGFIAAVVLFGAAKGSSYGFTQFVIIFLWLGIAPILFSLVLPILKVEDEAESLKRFPLARKLWTLDYILSEDRSIDLFRIYLKTIYAEENLTFWLDTKRFHKKPNLKLFHSIYATYLLPNAPLDVNIPQDMKKIEQMNSVLAENLNVNYFEEMRGETFDIMQYSSFQGFLLSKQAALLELYQKNDHTCSVD